MEVVEGDVGGDGDLCKLSIADRHVVGGFTLGKFSTRRVLCGTLVVRLLLSRILR